MLKVDEGLVETILICLLDRLPAISTCTAKGKVFAMKATVRMA